MSKIDEIGTIKFDTRLIQVAKGDIRAAVMLAIGAHVQAYCELNKDEMFWMSIEDWQELGFGGWKAQKHPRNILKNLGARDNMHTWQEYQWKWPAKQAFYVHGPAIEILISEQEDIPEKIHEIGTVEFDTRLIRVVGGDIKAAIMLAIGIHQQVHAKRKESDTWYMSIDEWKALGFGGKDAQKTIRCILEKIMFDNKKIWKEYVWRWRAKKQGQAFYVDMDVVNHLLKQINTPMEHELATA